MVLMPSAGTACIRKTSRGWRMSPVCFKGDRVRRLPLPITCASFADQIRAFMPEGMRYTVLGTDGYGRSDSRAQLRDFFRG